GVPQIEVSFDIDANGILNVSAVDKGTGKQQNIRIEASTGLSKEEIEHMKNEAQANADADREARERVDKLNSADSLIFQTEKQLKEYGDKIPAEKKSTIESALADLKEAHKAEDLGRVDTAVEALNQAWQAASQDMYQASQQAGGEQQQAQTEDTADGSNDSEKKDDVTDVEYEEVNNN
ncbi:MAG: Hsp70 family protein, partial [Saprospiraceae bacterium]